MTSWLVTQYTYLAPLMAFYSEWLPFRLALFTFHICDLFCQFWLFFDFWLAKEREKYIFTQSKRRWVFLLFHIFPQLIEHCRTNWNTFFVYVIFAGSGVFHLMPFCTMHRIFFLRPFFLLFSCTIFVSSSICQKYFNIYTGDLIYIANISYLHCDTFIFTKYSHSLKQLRFYWIICAARTLTKSMEAKNVTFTFLFKRTKVHPQKKCGE